MAAVTFLFLGFAGYSFLQADWSPAPGNPPENNVAAPINVGESVSSFQPGKGSLQFDFLGARDTVKSNIEMRSPKYCNENGAKCFTAEEVGRTEPGYNELATMRSVGYPVGYPLGINEWPNALVCEDNSSNAVIILHPHLVSTNATTKGDVRYRDQSGSRFYEFTSQGYFKSRYNVDLNCSSKSNGDSIVNICNANLCIY